MSDFKCFYRFGCVYETKNGKLMADLEIEDEENEGGRDVMVLTCLEDHEEYAYTPKGKLYSSDTEEHTLVKYRGDIPLMTYRVYYRSQPSPYFVSLHKAIQFIQERKLDTAQCEIRQKLLGFRDGMPEITAYHVRGIDVSLTNDVMLKTNTITYTIPPEPKRTGSGGGGSGFGYLWHY